MLDRNDFGRKEASLAQKLRAAEAGFYCGIARTLVTDAPIVALHGAGAEAPDLSLFAANSTRVLVLDRIYAKRGDDARGTPFIKISGDLFQKVQAEMTRFGPESLNELLFDYPLRILQRLSALVPLQNITVSDPGEDSLAQVRFQFSWRHPNDSEEKDRIVELATGDLMLPGTYLSSVPNACNLYFQIGECIGNCYIPSSYPRFIPQIGATLQLGGFLVMDNCIMGDETHQGDPLTALNSGQNKFEEIPVPQDLQVLGQEINEMRRESGDSKLAQVKIYKKTH